MRAKSALLFFGLVLSSLVLAMVTACGPTQEAARNSLSAGYMRALDLATWVREADAIVVGRIAEQVGTNVAVFGKEGDETYKIYPIYRIEVEQYITPSKEGLPKSVTVVTEGGEADFRGMHIHDSLDGMPQWAIGERILVALVGFTARDYEMDKNLSVPQGTDKATFYRVNITRDYGKFVPEERSWVDEMTGKELAISEITAVSVNP